MNAVLTKWALWLVLL